MKRVWGEGIVVETFSVTWTARTALEAFKLARQEALYWHGHAGRTGTIAEKPGFRLMGQLTSRQHNYLDAYLRRAEDWHNRAGHKNRSQYPRRLPPSIAPLFAEAIPLYVDPEAPAVCFQITGSHVLEIKTAMGRKHSWDKAWWFGGRSPA